MAEVNHTETWKDIKGYEGLYKVSNFGRIKSLARKLTLKLVGSRWGKSYVRIRTVQEIIRKQQEHRGHWMITLSENGKRKGFSTHRLVLDAFVGPCPEGMECCHNDGNGLNNHVDNLRWDTAKANGQDRIKHGTSNAGSTHAMAKLTEELVKQMRLFHKSGKFTIRELSEIYETSYCQVSQIVHRKIWKHVP